MLVPELHSDGISSLSARRAWIEISANALPITSPTVALRKESVDRNIIFNTCRAEPIQSLSARRAWIEIDAIAVQAANSSGRSPQGERG